MLSRPSFSIRRLISQRKPDHTEDDGLQSADGAQDGARNSNDEVRNKTWPKGNRKGPIPTIEIRRSEDIHRIVVLPPLPDTPKSWTSSICSVDDDKIFSSPRASPTPPTEKRFPGSPNRTPQRSPQRSPLLTPRQCEFPQRFRSRSLGPSSSGLSLPYSPPSSPRSQPRNDGDSPISPVDIADAYFLAPQAKEKLWAGEALSPGRVGRSRSRAYTDDIQQLIRETDEAFRLRHSIPGTRLPSPRTLRGPTIAGGPVLAKPSPPGRRASQRSNRSSTRSTKTQTTPSLKIPRIATPAAFASVSKTKKKQGKKPPGQRSRAASTTPAPRWTLTESAKDLFNIRIFNKIEADEVLPESVLNEIRMSRATQAKLAKETEQGNSNAEENHKQPGHPFTSESSSPKGSYEGDDARKSVESMTRSRSPAPAQWGNRPHGEPSTDEEHQESPVDVFPVYLDEEGTFPLVIVGDDQQTTPAKIKLPTKPMHRRHPHKHMPLPTIPEIIASGAENAFLSPTSRRKGTSPTGRLNTNDYIYLQSTPFTLTAPSFRHGPIRIAKPDRTIGQLAAAVDDTLDWTAFQMAIIGGAGDFFTEATDYSRPSDSELDERDEMATWFAEFGFEGPGALVPAAEALRLYQLGEEAATAAPTSKPVEAPIAVAPSVTVTDAGKTHLPPRGSSLAWRVEPPPPPFPTTNYMISTTGIGAGQEGVGNWLRYSPPPQYESRGNYIPSLPRNAFGTFHPNAHAQISVPMRGNRVSTESEVSLPQSPMLDLVVNVDTQGNEYMVSMGYNLHHDLPDYLSWSAEHMFGGGYHDSEEIV
ncbi:hypothetical protein QBC34DRAFT_93723 [Podospora aff. communis PSN243]|uniref:Uncharacterized protein n=1 Tax=Podospora aff. communis PSN243 TaxID=3040156 RepID=A0AAV9GLW2_9PEZI|nr:hypothetical protein QBC34DRAFT_93723 [Podospora aff. communis PSN243]